MDSIGFILITILVTGIFWLVISNPNLFNNLSSNQKVEEDYENEIPLKDVFYEFNHESTKAWLKWIDGQDESKKQFAYQLLTDYLELPPKKLGAITSDVVKAIVVFKKKTDAFDVLARLLKKCRNLYAQFKSIDMFYEATAVGLTKINHEKAETFLINELQEANFGEGLVTIQKYLIRAICQLEINPNLEKCWVRIVTSKEYPQATKKELLDFLETKADKIRERVYFKIFSEQINSNTGKLNENDRFVIEEVFYKLKKLITKDDYDEKVWELMSQSCDSDKIGELMIQLLADMIKLEERSLSQNQLLELLNKQGPARQKFIEACSSKFKLSELELGLLKTPIKQEDLEFEKTTFNIEKSKKTRSITHELLSDYHNLEKIMLHNETGKADKASTSISVLTGTGEKEKLYLLRGFAANRNRSFIYVDLEKLLHSEGIAKEFRNHVANSKPCLVYLDNITNVLNIDLDKKEASIFKSLTRSIKELSILPSISFTANIPYSTEDLMKSNLTLVSKIINGVGSMYQTIMTKNKPDETVRAKIIQTYLNAIDPARVNASEDFSLEELIVHTATMDTLELTLFLHQYFEVSLLANGKLVSLEEFQNRWIAPISATEEDNIEEIIAKTTAELVAEDSETLDLKEVEEHSAKL